MTHEPDTSSAAPSSPSSAAAPSAANASAVGRATTAPGFPASPLAPLVFGFTRIVFGLMFMPHGAQKLFAVLGREEVAATFSQIWFAGVLEFFGGLLVVLGLLTRPVAFVLSGLMAWAYFQVHVGQAFFPIENGGELAVLYCWFFFLLAFAGSGAWSVDGWIAGRRDR